MNVGNLLPQLQEQLEHAGILRARILVRQLLACRLSCDQASLLAHPERNIPEQTMLALQKDMANLAAGMPEAYVFGQVPFLEWDFAIDSRALIPRPETEDLTQKVRQNIKIAPRLILDLCCGSGVMGLSLAMSFPEARVILTDLSFDALALCQKNIHKLGLEGRAWCVAGDLWDAVPEDHTFDLIVANPPYVAEDDPLQAEVAEWEPAMALYSQDRGMAHLKTILYGLDTYLKPGGLAALECGHYHSEILQKALDASRIQGRIRWHKDPFGVPRFLFYDG